MSGNTVQFQDFSTSIQQIGVILFDGVNEVFNTILLSGGCIRLPVRPTATTIQFIVPQAVDPIITRPYDPNTTSLYSVATFRNQQGQISLAVANIPGSACTPRAGEDGTSNLFSSLQQRPQVQIIRIRL